MKMIRCDGCDATENFINRKAPDNIIEISVSISPGPDKGDAFHQVYDLCGSCQARLKHSMRVTQWPRATKHEPGAFYEIDPGLFVPTTPATRP